MSKSWKILNNENFNCVEFEALAPARKLIYGIYMAKKYRKTEMYEGVRIDIRANDLVTLGEKLKTKKDEIDGKVKRINKNMTVYAWSKEYRETYRMPTVSPNTYKDDLSINKLWITPNIGNLPLGYNIGHCSD